MREFSLRFFLPLLFLSLLGFTISVYGDCEVTPPDVEPKTRQDCLNYNPGSTDRTDCCEKLYPLNNPDPTAGNPETARYLCQRAEKMNPTDAATFNQSFTNPSGPGTAPAGRLPIIFLPGIGGSELYEAKNQNNDLWPTA